MRWKYNPYNKTWYSTDGRYAVWIQSHTRTGRKWNSPEWAATHVIGESAKNPTWIGSTYGSKGMAQGACEWDARVLAATAADTPEGRRLERERLEGTGYMLGGLMITWTWNTCLGCGHELKSLQQGQQPDPETCMYCPKEEAHGVG